MMEFVSWDDEIPNIWKVTKKKYICSKPPTSIKHFLLAQKTCATCTCHFLSSHCDAPLCSTQVMTSQKAATAETLRCHFFFDSKVALDSSRKTSYLVGGIPTILKNTSSSMGRIIPYMENKTCLKPPTRYLINLNYMMCLLHFRQHRSFFSDREETIGTCYWSVLLQDDHG